MTLSRRRLLWLTAAAAGGLAGCSASSGERTESPTRNPVNEMPTESADRETASASIEPLVEGQTRTEMAEPVEFRPRDRSSYPPISRPTSPRAAGGQVTA